MKKAIVVLSAIALCAFVFYSFIKKETTNTKTSIQFVPVNYLSDLRIIDGQDVSASIKSNGIELVGAGIFRPYFDSTNRNIDLYAGVISGRSSQKLLRLTLTKITFRKPIAPDFHHLLITEREQLQKAYSDAIQKYHTDSLQYFTDRSNRIAAFAKSFDSLINKYRNHLTEQTDLGSFLSLSDKVFNFSDSSTENYLLLNSDGINDSRYPIVKLKNKVTTILINGDGIIKTSLDSIISLTLEDSEQAIAYTLHHQ